MCQEACHLWLETRLKQILIFSNSIISNALVAMVASAVVPVEDEIQQFSVSSDEENEDVELW